MPARTGFTKVFGPEQWLLTVIGLRVFCLDRFSIKQVQFKEPLANATGVRVGVFSLGVGVLNGNVVMARDHDISVASEIRLSFIVSCIISWDFTVPPTNPFQMPYQVTNAAVPNVVSAKALGAPNKTE